MARTSKEAQIQHDQTCYEKARRRGQRTFTLVEQDRSAARTVLFWIMENLNTAPQSKLEDAFEDVMGFQFTQGVDKKNAD